MYMRCECFYPLTLYKQTETDLQIFEIGSNKINQMSKRGEKNNNKKKHRFTKAS